MKKIALIAGLALLFLSPLPSTIGLTSDTAVAQKGKKPGGAQTWRLYVNGKRTGSTFPSLSACEAAGRRLMIQMGGGTYSCNRE